MSGMPRRPTFAESSLFRGRLTLVVPRNKAVWLRDRLRASGLEAVVCYEPFDTTLEFGPDVAQDAIVRALGRIDGEAGRLSGKSRDSNS